MLDLDMDLGELRVERGGAEQLPAISGLSGTVHVCIAMFFNGASCELRELSLSGGHYKSPYVPCTSTPGLPMAGSSGSGVPRTSSVPRLALKDVGEIAPSSREPKPPEISTRDVESVSANGALGPGHDSIAAPLISGNARPSPRLGGASLPATATVGPHRLLTPRTLALSEGTGMTVERPSPQGTPRTISSPRGSLVSLCPAGIYPSPRYVSPRTPRSIQQPSPRKPEAVAATLTISQHKELDSAIRRVETLEEHLSVTLAENRRLQEALSRVLGRGGHVDADLNGDADGADCKSSASVSTGSDQPTRRSEELTARKGDDAPFSPSMHGKGALPGNPEGESSCVRELKLVGDEDCGAKRLQVQTGTQVSPGDLSSQTDVLLKHWELDWKSLEKVFHFLVLTRDDSYTHQACQEQVETTPIHIRPVKNK